MGHLSDLVMGRRRRAATPWHEIDSQRVLDVLVHNLEGMLFRCAIDNDWTLHFVSEGAKALTGYSPAELEHNRAISCEELTHPDDRALVRDVVLSAIENRSRYRVVYRIRCKDGTEKWVRECGLGVIDENGDQVVEGFTEDLSDQVAAQNQVLEAELRYRSIFENSVIGIFQT